LRIRASCQSESVPPGNAIFDRIEEILAHPVPNEHRAMNEALRHL